MYRWTFVREINRYVAVEPLFIYFFHIPETLLMFYFLYIYLTYTCVQFFIVRIVINTIKRAFYFMNLALTIGTFLNPFSTGHSVRRCRHKHNLRAIYRQSQIGLLDNYLLTRRIWIINVINSCIVLLSYEFSLTIVTFLLLLLLFVRVIFRLWPAQYMIMYNDIILCFQIIPASPPPTPKNDP